MSPGIIDRLREHVTAFPSDERARYFLANELFKREDWEGAAEQLEAYFELGARDEGAGYRCLGLSLERLGRRDRAAEVYRRGIDAALAHHHDGMAAEIRSLLDSMES